MNHVDAAVQRQQAARILLPVTVVLCVAAGVIAGLSYGAAAQVAFGILLVAGAYKMVGAPGIILLLPVLYCFAGLNRIDDIFSIGINERFRIPVAYWLTVLCVLLLALTVPWGRYARAGEVSPGQRFARRFVAGLLLFVGLCAFSLFLNHLSDPYVKDRSAIAEVLSLGAIVFPMALVAVIPMTNLSKSHTRMCMQAMIGLAAATGLILAVFGLMPERFIGLLGWTGFGFGTVDLVRGRTPLGHPNTVAALLQIFMAICVVLGVRQKGALFRGLYLAAAGAIFIGILFSLSRTALGVSGITLMLVFAYLLLSRKQSRGVEMFLIGGFFAVLICGMVYLFMTYDFSRFWSRGYYEVQSIGGRTESMRTAALVWLDHPLFGTGPGAMYPRLESEYGWVYEGFSDVGFVFYYRGHITLPHPHNMYLLMLAEFGLLGTAAAVFLIGSVGWMLYRLRKRLEGRELDHELVTAAMFGLLATLLSGMAESLFLINMRHGIVIWTFFGLAIRYGIATEQEDAPRESAPEQVSGL